MHLSLHPSGSVLIRIMESISLRSMTHEQWACSTHLAHCSAQSWLFPKWGNVSGWANYYRWEPRIDFSCFTWYMNEAKKTRTEIYDVCFFAYVVVVVGDGGGGGLWETLQVKRNGGKRGHSPYSLNAFANTHSHGATYVCTQYSRVSKLRSTLYFVIMRHFIRF